MTSSPKVTYAFVDAANVIYRASDPDPWKIDLKKLFKYLTERFCASRVFYFGGVDDENKTQLRIYERLKSWGYELRLNPVKHFVNVRGEEKIWLLASPRKTAKELKQLFGGDFANLDNLRSPLEYQGHT